MFGHENHDEQQQNDQGHSGTVTAPVDPVADDSIVGLSDESVKAEPSSAPTANSANTGFSMEPAKSPPTNTPAPVTDSPTTPTVSDDLLNIKQEALQHLSPLINHLDQDPEEKFRTTMMMIQASDDQTLVKQAYETAKLIPDEKVRAQALLDIVNEINYFTQQQKDKQ